MASELDNWTVERWLKKLGLRKYKQAFIDNGYETADLCANMNKEDLDAIGVTNKHHRSTLFTQARKLLTLLNEEGLTASVEDSIDYPKGTPPQERRSPPSNNIPPPPTSNPPPSGAPQPLPDYSEPWNSSNTGPPVPTSPTSKGGFSFHKGTNGTAVEPAPDAPNSGPHHKRKPPTSPGAELPAFKREGSSGLTRLQLKLKIREELFVRGVVLSEAPYCNRVSLNIGRRAGVGDVPLSLGDRAS